MLAKWLVSQLTVTVIDENSVGNTHFFWFTNFCILLVHDLVTGLPLAFFWFTIIVFLLVDHSLCRFVFYDSF